MRITKDGYVGIGISIIIKKWISATSSKKEKKIQKKN
jgi:hypothetical protein